MNRMRVAALRHGGGVWEDHRVEWYRPNADGVLRGLCQKLGGDCDAFCGDACVSVHTCMLRSRSGKVGAWIAFGTLTRNEL